MIGRDEDGSSEVPPKESDWTKKESIPYDDASDLYVLPEWSDWTRRNLVLSSGNASDWLVRWICLLETLLIGWFDGYVFWRFFWILFTSRFTISYSHSGWARNDYANASSFCDEYAVKSAVDARNRQNDRHLCYLLYPWWSFKTVHYANDVARKVCTCSTCSEYYDT